MDAGDEHTCGLTDAGTLPCWGWAGNSLVNEPAGVFTNLRLESDNPCALRADGSAVCWGNNNGGGIVPNAGLYTHLDSYSDGTCGIRTTGAGSCWGSHGGALAGLSQLTLGVGAVDGLPPAHEPLVSQRLRVGLWRTPPGRARRDRAPPTAGVFDATSCLVRAVRIELAHARRMR